MFNCAHDYGPAELEWSDWDNPDFDEYTARCRLCGHVKRWIMLDDYETPQDPIAYRFSLYEALKPHVDDPDALRDWLFGSLTDEQRRAFEATWDRST